MNSRHTIPDASSQAKSSETPSARSVQSTVPRAWQIRHSMAFGSDFTFERATSLLVVVTLSFEFSPLPSTWTIFFPLIVSMYFVLNLLVIVFPLCCITYVIEAFDEVSPSIIYFQLRIAQGPSLNCTTVTPSVTFVAPTL